jgi:hypothetical protein
MERTPEELLALATAHDEALRELNKASLALIALAKDRANCSAAVSAAAARVGACTLRATASYYAIVGTTDVEQILREGAAKGDCAAHCADREDAASSKLLERTGAVAH